MNLPATSGGQAMRTPGTFVALVAVALLTACSSQKEPAENAVAQLEASLNEVRADAQQYSAEQLQSVEASINRLKENLAKQEYGTALKAAPAVRSDLESLKSATATAKTHAEEMLAAR